MQRLLVGWNLTANSAQLGHITFLQKKLWFSKIVDLSKKVLKRLHIKEDNHVAEELKVKDDKMSTGKIHNDTTNPNN